MSRGVLALVSAVIALAVGLWLGGHPADLPGPIRDTFVQEDRALRAEIIDSIEGNFYKPVKESKLDDASLKGIVESLDDPYSSYLTAKEARQFDEDVSGHFEGVGMNVEQDKRGLKVLRVFDGSPAQDAHIQAGDFILAVNGRPIAGVNSEVSTNRIKGPAGTSVELRVFTPGRALRPHREGQARAHRGAAHARAAGGEERAQDRRGRADGLQRRRPRGARPRHQAPAEAAARRGSCSTCAATPADCCSRAWPCRASSSRTGGSSRCAGGTAPSACTTPWATRSCRRTCRWPCSWTAAARAPPRS